MRIPIFDCHIHSDYRSAEDYELMAVSGVEAILVPCTFTGLQKYSADAYRSSFDRVVGLEHRRASKFGIRLYAALSVHPGDIVDYQIATAAVDIIGEYLDHETVVAIGEVSLKTCSEPEIDLLLQQMALAMEHNVPVLIESPVGRAKAGGDRFVEAFDNAIRTSGMPRDKIMILDMNPARMARYWALDLGGYGIPVAPPLNGLFVIHDKVAPREAGEMLKAYGTGRLMFNSALHFGYGDPLCLSRTLLHLSAGGVPDAELAEVAHGNALQFFGIESR